FWVLQHQDAPEGSRVGVLVSARVAQVLPLDLVGDRGDLLGRASAAEGAVESRDHGDAKGSTSTQTSAGRDIRLGDQENGFISGHQPAHKSLEELERAAAGKGRDIAHAQPFSEVFRVNDDTA